MKKGFTFNVVGVGRVLVHCLSTPDAQPFKLPLSAFETTPDVLAHYIWNGEISRNPDPDPWKNAGIKSFTY